MHRLSSYRKANTYTRSPVYNRQMNLASWVKKSSSSWKKITIFPILSIWEMKMPFLDHWSLEWGLDEGYLIYIQCYKFVFVCAINSSQQHDWDILTKLFCKSPGGPFLPENLLGSVSSEGAPTLWVGLLPPSLSSPEPFKTPWRTSHLN